MRKIDKLIFGIGINDHNGNISANKKLKKCYKVWCNMLSRCYDDKYTKIHQTYIGCTVCEEWLSFNNFNKWFIKNNIEGYALDKDILFKGNKIYSPETCAFIPQEINNLFEKSNRSRGKYPIGVSYHNQRKKFKSRLMVNNKEKHLGLFVNIIDAFNAYKEAKENNIKSMAESYYSNRLISNNIYNAMLNYTVDIND